MPCQEFYQTGPERDGISEFIQIMVVLLSIIDYLQSAIGEGMTRKDHSDVSNQVCFDSLIINLLVFT